MNITMNRYVHPSMDLKKENMQRLSDLLAVNKLSHRQIMLSFQCLAVFFRGVMYSTKEYTQEEIY